MRQNETGLKNNQNPKNDAPQASLDSQGLLSWYDSHGRQLPWRHYWPDLAPAYHVFLSELMLQQTVVATVIPYFHNFIKRWPDLEALAAAPLEDVLEAWAGIGYYARARNLHKTAQLLVSEYNGAFPDNTEALKTLPGIGPYTAGAIASFAFDKPAIVIDGNIERVLSRYFGLRTPLPALKAEIGAIFLSLIPDKRRSDFPQALMDLASLVCQPKTAACDICPLLDNCAAARWNDPTILPVKPPKMAKPVRSGQAFVLFNQKGEVAVQRRPAKGLLGGMLGFPSHGWDKSKAHFQEQALRGVNPKALIQSASISHIFTHFKAEIEILRVNWPANTPLPEPLFWTDTDTALPTLMAKILKSAQKSPE